MCVSTFRDPRIMGYMLLPAAFRSLSRLSSALSAKASTLRSYWLNLLFRPMVLVTSLKFDLHIQFRRQGGRLRTRLREKLDAATERSSAGPGIENTKYSR